MKMSTEKDEKWIFSREKLQENSSRKAGIDIDKELSYRQQAANLIQDMGQRLSVNQLTINTAIVYMHRFYVYHSFTVFSRYAIAPTALFLAAKVEEQPKKLQHVLQICHACLHPDKPNLDTHSDAYMKQAQELVQNELALLQTLGFEISVDHPHTHVVKCTQLVKASRDLSQMAYFMATNSLHLTTFCLVYKPTVVAAMCIHLSCKWSNYEIPLSSDGKHYWSYMDPSITEPLLETIITEFLKILNRCPTRLRKLKNYRPSQNAKADQDAKDDDKQFHFPSALTQGPSQTTKKPSQPQPAQSQPPLPPPAKEKKQTLSIEEYKKAQAAKTMTKAPTHQRTVHNHTPQPPSSSVQVKKPDTANNHSSWPSNPPAHTKPVQNAHFAKGPKPPVELSDMSHKNMMRPALPQHSKPVEPHRRSHDAVQSKQHQAKPVFEELDARVGKKPHDHDAHRSSQAHASSRAGRDAHDQSRSHAENADGHSNKIKQLDSKQMAELYYKNPEKLRHYLKARAQTVRLNTEEKNLYMKLQAKEEERRKRKAAEVAKQKEQKSSVDVASVESPSGAPLTLRIKLGSKTDISKHSSVAKIVAPDSNLPVAASRKRPHDGHGSHPTKHAKKSDRHKHHPQHGLSGSGSSSGESRHRHSHHKPPSSTKPVIDEAVFQKSLSEAMNQVQQQQQTVIPTVTLKRTSNGKNSSYFSTASNRHGFDPAMPVSAQIPDDIFEEDQASATADRPGSSVGSAEESSADVSTPESGEIKESPNRAKKRAHRSNKVTSLFSPDARSDSQLIRSSSGYHSSSQDADFPPALLQKH